MENGIYYRKTIKKGLKIRTKGLWRNVFCVKVCMNWKNQQQANESNQYLLDKVKQFAKNHDLFINDVIEHSIKFINLDQFK
jgi:hypothetical protein